MHHLSFQYTTLQQGKILPPTSTLVLHIIQNSYFSSQCCGVWPLVAGWTSGMDQSPSGVLPQLMEKLLSEREIMDPARDVYIRIKVLQILGRILDLPTPRTCRHHLGCYANASATALRQGDSPQGICTYPLHLLPWVLTHMAVVGPLSLKLCTSQCPCTLLYNPGLLAMCK